MAYWNDEQGITDVPDHILDKVATEADRYFKEEQERLLGAYSDDAKVRVCQLSTHAKIVDPESREERRKLHKEIILQMVGGKKPSPDGKPTVLLFAGPPGAGKSTLRKRFEEDEAFEDEYLEEARKLYQSQQDSVVSIDFNLFKKMLPEYNAANLAFKERHGDMYAVIRSE